MNGVTIIGPGRMGGALALALDRAGVSVEEIVYRTADLAIKIASGLSQLPRLTPFEQLASVETSIILITSGDNQIEIIAKHLAGFVAPGTVVLHTSGSLPSNILADLSDAGCSVGSMHPLVSISNSLIGSERFHDSYFCIEGAPAAMLQANILAGKLGAKPFSIPTSAKALYHAAAVMGSGHLVALIESSIEMLVACGLDADAAKDTLMPLVQSTLENLKVQNSEAALTGTFARADLPAFERHIEAMQNVIPTSVIETYLILAERSLMLAEKHGADIAKVRKLRQRISLAKGNSE